MADVVARKTGLTLPHPKGLPILCPRKRPLPCYIILVHGVNDVGEAYAAQEQGLCWGLGERLDRIGDFKPHDYTLPKPQDPLLANPDKVYFHRRATKDAFSPVIPFYWGFREEDHRIQRDTWHGEWLDRHGNRLDKDGAKNGGPFANAANCLPHMWAPGWREPMPFTNFGASLQDKTHPMFKAPERRYQVLAAMRLAMVIRIIRRRHPEAAINLVAHSMGCLVSLLANAFLLEDGHPPADALIMNNPPYGLEETALDNQLYGGMNQTSRARIETLKSITRAFHAHRRQSPDLATVLTTPGLAGPRRGILRHPITKQDVPFAERDNRGLIHLYFSPEDSTVALLNTQGIGWQGVPDTFTSEWTVITDSTQGTWGPVYTRKHCRCHWDTLLKDLHAHGFRQRVFMARKRLGKQFLVGLPPQHVSIYEKGDRGGEGILSKSMEKHIMRGITGDPLPIPVAFDLGAAQLPISPIDAAVALTNNGTAMISEITEDPRPLKDRTPLQVTAPNAHADIDPIRWTWNKNKPRTQQVPKLTEASPSLDKDQHPNGNLHVTRAETPDETRARLQRSFSENSHHSSIVANHWHSQAVTTYDLALGKPIPGARENTSFMTTCARSRTGGSSPLESLPCPTNLTHSTSMAFSTVNQSNSKY